MQAGGPRMRPASVLRACICERQQQADGAAKDLLQLLYERFLFRFGPAAAPGTIGGVIWQRTLYPLQGVGGLLHERGGFKH